MRTRRISTYSQTREAVRPNARRQDSRSGRPASTASEVVGEVQQQRVGCQRNSEQANNQTQRNTADGEAVQRGTEDTRTQDRDEAVRQVTNSTDHEDLVELRSCAQLAVREQSQGGTCDREGCQNSPGQPRRGSAYPQQQTGHRAADLP